MALPKILESLYGRCFGLSHRGALVVNFGTEGGVRSGRVPLVLEPPVAASTAISNTIVETLFDAQVTIPKNTLHAGSTIRIEFQGIVTAHNATDTLAIKLYLGGLTGTALIALAARNTSVNDIFTGYFDIIVRTNGSTGTFVGNGAAAANANVAGTALGSQFIGSTAIDTTAAQVIGVSATWSAASAADSARLDFLMVEIT